MGEDDILQEIERRHREQHQRVRETIFQAGRPDLVADLDAKMRDIRLGVDSARSCWHALSGAQRNAMKIMEPGRKLMRRPHSSWYVGIGRPEACGRVCRTPTVRNLIARELVDLEGGVFDPEATVTLSDRGRFVLKHGRG